MTWCSQNESIKRKSNPLVTICIINRRTSCLQSATNVTNPPTPPAPRVTICIIHQRTSSLLNATKVPFCGTVTIPTAQTTPPTPSHHHRTRTKTTTKYYWHWNHNIKLSSRNSNNRKNRSNKHSKWLEAATSQRFQVHRSPFSSIFNIFHQFLNMFFFLLGFGQSFGSSRAPHLVQPK